MDTGLLKTIWNRIDLWTQSHLSHKPLHLNLYIKVHLPSPGYFNLPVHNYLIVERWKSIVNPNNAQIDIISLILNSQISKCTTSQRGRIWILRRGCFTFYFIPAVFIKATSTINAHLKYFGLPHRHNTIVEILRTLCIFSSEMPWRAWF